MALGERQRLPLVQAEVLTEGEGDTVGVVDALLLGDGQGEGVRESVGEAHGVPVELPVFDTELLALMEKLVDLEGGVDLEGD